MVLLEFPVFALLLSRINHKRIYHYSPSTSSFYKSGAIRACNNSNRWNKMTSGHYGYLYVYWKRGQNNVSSVMAARVENMFSLRTLSEAGEKKRKKIEKNWQTLQYWPISEATCNHLVDITSFYQKSIHASSGCMYNMSGSVHQVFV